MIEQIVAERCTACGLCIQVCPTNVFSGKAGELPLIARQQDCQTCFMCELYCRADALFVAADCDRAVAVDSQALVASGLLGQFRRNSGWDEWSDDPAHANEHWRMDDVFARARELA